MLFATASARAAGAELTQLRVERSDGGLFVSARVDFQLSPAVEDALRKGIAVQFVAEVEVLRERWYWSDRAIVSASRYMRVAYQPLTRRWRLSTSAEPLANAGLGVSLSQTFDSLEEAIGAVQRIGRWRIADASVLDSGGREILHFSFRLDVAQLPRTLQIGTAGNPEWALGVERRVDLTQELAR